MGGESSREKLAVTGAVFRWKPVEARWLSLVELLSLRPGQFSVPVSPSAYKIKSLHFVEWEAFRGGGSSRSVTLVTYHSAWPSEDTCRPCHFSGLLLMPGVPGAPVYPFKLISDTIFHHTP